MWVDQDLLRTLTARVLARRRAGQSPRAPSLPASKDGFPKLLCLDQNKWIDLARAAHGREDGKRYELALRAVRRALRAGRLLVPVLSSNVADLAATGSRERRTKLARFMVELSDNTTALNDVMLDALQIHAVLSTWSGSEPLIHLREHLVHRGPWPLAGAEPRVTGNPELDAFLAEVMSEPERSVANLVELLEQDWPHLTERELETAGALREVREIDRELPSREKELREARTLLTTGSVAAIIRAQASDLGIPEEALAERLDDDHEVVALLTQLPGVDVARELILRRERSFSHAIKAGDVRDIGFFKVAVPYANIVVGERSWADCAMRAALPARYRTQIITDAALLPSMLADLGCIDGPT